MRNNYVPFDFLCQDEKDTSGHFVMDMQQQDMLWDIEDIEVDIRCWPSSILGIRLRAQIFVFSVLTSPACAQIS